MPRLNTRHIAVAVLPIAFACQAPANQRASAAVIDSSATTGAMASNVSSSSRPDSSIEATVTAVTNDVRALRTATPAVAESKLPAHEQLVNGMLTTFESRIRAMHVHADPSWTSVIDSVRTDLAHLPTMKADALPAFLPQHLNRVMRIVVCIQMVKS